MSPLTVTAWPYYPDPRTPQFSIIGYAFGMVPPDRLLLTTVGATTPFDDLNVGVLLVLSAEAPPLTTYTSQDGAYRLEKTGFFPPAAGPPIHSVLLQVFLDRPPEPVYTGFIQQLHPPGIQAFDINADPPAPPPDKVPNPITFTPRNFTVVF